MKRFYVPIRAIHLVTALFSLGFVLLYALSALQFAHPRWFDLRPATAESSLRISPSLTPREAARALRSSAGLRGDLLQIRESASAVRFRIAQPGVVHDVAYSPPSGEVKLKTSRYGFLGMLGRLHTTAGLWHDAAAVNAYGVVVGSFSLALLLLGASGLYLWFVRLQEWKFSAVFLALSLLWGLGAIFAMRFG